MVGTRKSVPKDKRTERSQRRRKQTAGEILEAARLVLLREGIANFTLGAVAEQLELTTPALYYYFDSKESLLSELLLCEWLECASEVEAAVEKTETGADAIEQLMRTVFTRYLARPDLFRLAYKTGHTQDFGMLMGPGELSRVRPTNEMFYAGTDKRLRAGGVPEEAQPAPSRLHRPHGGAGGADHENHSRVRGRPVGAQGQGSDR